MFALTSTAARLAPGPDVFMHSAEVVAKDLWLMLQLLVLISILGVTINAIVVMLCIQCQLRHHGRPRGAYCGTADPDAGQPQHPLPEQATALAPEAEARCRRTETMVCF